jgi:hypothetical protein
MQTIRMNHERRMGAVEHLMPCRQIVNVPKEVGLSEGV